MCIRRRMLLGLCMLNHCSQLILHPQSSLLVTQSPSPRTCLEDETIRKSSKKYVFYNIIKNSTKLIKIFFGAFSKPHKIFSLKKKNLTCFLSNQTKFYVHKSKEVNPCNGKILTRGPLSYLF